MTARAAVETLDGVSGVVADMYGHTVKVTLSGTGATVDNVVKALNDAGYTVGVPSVVQP